MRRKMPSGAECLPDKIVIPTLNVIGLKPPQLPRRGKRVDISDPFRLLGDNQNEDGQHVLAARRFRSPISAKVVWEAVRKGSDRAINPVLVSIMSELGETLTEQDPHFTHLTKAQAATLGLNGCSHRVDITPTEDAVALYDVERERKV